VINGNNSRKLRSIFHGGGWVPAVPEITMLELEVVSCVVELGSPTVYDLRQASFGVNLWRVILLVAGTHSESILRSKFWPALF
jgi:hypothetical protein